MLSIREYVHQLDWNNICRIHDNARIIELEGSVSEKAFIPLADCYKEEELFDSTIFVAEQNNETIGFIGFCNQEITWLYVDPKFFRQGYGKELIRFALNKVLKPVRVTVLNNNLRAINLYKGLGFNVEQKQKGKIPLTNIKVTSLRMVLNEWKKNIYLPKFVLYVDYHLIGEKNGKKHGKMLNIVVKNAEEIKIKLRKNDK